MDIISISLDINSIDINCISLINRFDVQPMALLNCYLTATKLLLKMNVTSISFDIDSVDIDYYLLLINRYQLFMNSG